MMIKKLIALSLLPVCIYAADGEVREEFGREESAFAEALQEIVGDPIRPSKFNNYGKGIVTHYVQVWVDAAKQGNIPQNQGLAKIFVDMQNDGVEKLINDGAALKKANTYLEIYDK